MPQPPVRRRAGGRPRKAANEKRSNSVNVWLTDEELALVDKRRAASSRQRGPYLRDAALNRLVPVVPELNRKAWLELARATSNLNQLMVAYNARNPRGQTLHGRTVLSTLHKTQEGVDALRELLLGAGCDESEDSPG